MSRDKVALLCPIGESVSPPVFQYALAAATHAVDNGIEMTDVGVTERTLIQSARNILVDGFLKTDAEWAFWMDADMILPRDVIPRLLATAKAKEAKFVTGVYYQRVGDHLPVLWVKEAQGTDGSKIRVRVEEGDLAAEAYRHLHVAPSPGATAPFAVDVCGFGCVLTHRSMFETIPRPWFKMLTGKCSEDFYFSIQAKNHGFQLWADPSLQLGHVGKPQVIYREHFDSKKHQVKEATTTHEVNK